MGRLTYIYRYKPLENPRTDIRIGRLQPGEYDDTIQLSFHQKTLNPKSCDWRVNLRKALDFKTTTSAYEALSYAWGTKDNPSFVLVTKRKTTQGRIPITRNLDVALRHLRHRSRARSLWIDAICIDQSNDIEKGMQVAIMGQIYALARCVTAWVGPEENNSGEALDMMQHWADHIEVSVALGKMRPKGDTKESCWADTSIAFPYTNGELDSVCFLLQRPYFERLWIRQEVGLASLVMLQCGQREMPWVDFQKALACINWKSRLEFAVKKVSSAVLWRALHTLFDITQVYPQKQLSICDMKHWLRYTQCGDPRDRLFAVLTLLCEEDQQLGIEPDYTRSTREVFADAARRHVLKHNNLNILETCDLSAHSSQLPSWVPDWSVPLKNDRLFKSTWSACGWIPAQVTCVGQDSIRTSGIRVSQVESVVSFEFVEPVVSLNELLQRLRTLLPTVLSQGRNEQVSDLLQPCCEALLGDLHRDSYLPPNSKERSFQECKQFLGVVWSSDESYEQIVGRDNVPRGECLRMLSSRLPGRSFIRTSDGRLGLAPAATQKGDVVSILLGCRFPVVLRRPTSSPAPTQPWHVVGISQVSGLMHGEAIYRDALPGPWTFVNLTLEIEMENRSPYAMYNPATQEIKMDAIGILEEAGIRVERDEHDLHQSLVLPETLRAAGVEVEDFALV